MKVEAALTPAQWADEHRLVQCFDSWSDEVAARTGVAEISEGPGYLHLTSHQHGEFADCSAPSDRHRLAALALHDQPFGFTWEDVDTMEAVYRRVMSDLRPGSPSAAIERTVRLWIRLGRKVRGQTIKLDAYPGANGWRISQEALAAFREAVREASSDRRINPSPQPALAGDEVKAYLSELYA
jgi:hypothetical protein